VATLPIAATVPLMMISVMQKPEIPAVTLPAIAAQTVPSTRTSVLNR
jgi:hypothetical protein